MRQVGSLSNLDQAERFADYLFSQGTICSIDKGSDGYRVWVQDDDRVASAKQELPDFLADPNHVRYREAVLRATALRKEKQRRQDDARSNVVDVADSWRFSLAQQCPVTIGLIVISIIVAYFTQLEPAHYDQGGKRLLLIDPFAKSLLISTDRTFRQIRDGEVWRIISPIFLHFSLMHIAFNLLMTYQFGLQIEPRRGSFRLLSMVLLIAALSNLAQFWSPDLAQYCSRVFAQLWFHDSTQNPLESLEFRGHWLFGGMSGVVYGLFGYMWIKGKLDPRSGLGLPSQTVTAMLVWHVLCVVGVIPHVANWCHGIGLVTGMALAAGEMLIPSRLRRR